MPTSHPGCHPFTFGIPADFPQLGVRQPSQLRHQPIYLRLDPPQARRIAGVRGAAQNALKNVSVCHLAGNPGQFGCIECQCLPR
jgi:hypothetical protein